MDWTAFCDAMAILAAIALGLAAAVHLSVDWAPVLDTLPIDDRLALTAGAPQTANTWNATDVSTFLLVTRDLAVDEPATTSPLFFLPRGMAARVREFQRNRAPGDDCHHLVKAAVGLRSTVRTVSGVVAEAAVPVSVWRSRPELQRLVRPGGVYVATQSAADAARWLDNQNVAHVWMLALDAEWCLLGGKRARVVLAKWDQLLSPRDCIVRIGRLGAVREPLASLLQFCTRCVRYDRANR